MSNFLERIRKKRRARLRDAIVDSRVLAVRAPTRAEKRDHEDCALVLDISGPGWERSVYLDETPDLIAFERSRRPLTEHK